MSDLLRPAASGPAYALASAFLFGVSTPAAKALIAHIDGWLLAGLLYLGAGIGLTVSLVGSAARSRVRAGPMLTGSEWGWFAAAVVAGGIAAPLLLVFGLARMSGAAASLLLNLEAVATAVIAWLIFRENLGGRVALGLTSIVGASVILTWDGWQTMTGLAGPLAVTGACLLWAIDNNLTRKVSLADPIQIAAMKGLAAGTTNVALALLSGAAWPRMGAAAIAGTVGFFGYGISLALFVIALRHIGAARTGGYFSTAPFVGAMAAILFLHEPLTTELMIAGVLMGVGLWLHLSERHVHEHVHEPLTHTHQHRHDTHHRHSHGPNDPSGEPHTHRHVHARIKHRHPHYPDAHHRHQH